MTTRTERLPPVSTGTQRRENEPLIEDQIRDYRRNQRRQFLARQAIRRIGRAIRRSPTEENTLEQELATRSS